MEVATSGWPDFSSATITEAAPIEALSLAIAERCAVAHVAHESAEFDSGSGHYEPSLQRLVGIRSKLCFLADKFVRMEDDKYQWKSWAEFPRTYSERDLLAGGEHSLAIIPPRAAPDASPEQLALYRTFLENCAWWIRRFRYVDATQDSFFTRKATASGSKSIFDNIDGTHSEYGDEPEAALASPTIVQTDAGNRSANKNMFDYIHYDRISYEDYYSTSNGWIYNRSQGQERTINATACSGLVVRNMCGLDGRVLLVPCFTKDSSFPSEEEILWYVDSTMPPGPSWPYPDEVLAYECSDIRSYKDLHGTAWKEKRLTMDESENYFDNNDRLLKRGTITNTLTNWSLDGSRSHSNTESSSYSTGVGNNLFELTETSLDIFDGFGVWSCGVAIDVGVVSAHGRIVALPERNDMPLPDIWNLTQYRKWRPDLHPREVKQDSVECRSRLRIVPIIDFNGSYLYQE